MPAKQARSSTGRRPPLGRGGCGGNSGSTISHSSSATSGLAIASSLTDRPDFEPIGPWREPQFLALC